MTYPGQRPEPPSMSPHFLLILVSTSAKGYKVRHQEICVFVMGFCLRKIIPYSHIPIFCYFQMTLQDNNTWNTPYRQYNTSLNRSCKLILESQVGRNKKNLSSCYDIHLLEFEKCDVKKWRVIVHELEEIHLERENVFQLGLRARHLWKDKKLFTKHTNQEKPGITSTTLCSQFIPPTHYTGEIWNLKNAPITAHWGKLRQANHMIIVTSSFSKSSVFKMFCTHTKTQSRRLQVPPV